MDVKQKRVSECDADDCDRVSETKERGPGIESEIKKAVESNYEVAGVPPTHCECKQGKDAFDAGQLAAVRDQL